MERLPATLNAAGHRALAVKTASAFEEALAARRYDLIVAEAGDVRLLSAAIAAALPHPAVLPVLRKPTTTAVEAARRENARACVVLDADEKYDVLLDVDELMKTAQK
jgi:hypothetical protein